jgi:hypothetical protein
MKNLMEKVLDTKLGAGLFGAGLGLANAQIIKAMGINLAPEETFLIMAVLALVIMRKVK